MRHVVAIRGTVVRMEVNSLAAYLTDPSVAHKALLPQLLHSLASQSHDAELTDTSLRLLAGAIRFWLRFREE